jgi:hypothetical protein
MHSISSNEPVAAKRLSVRKVAMTYGIPPRVVARAVANKELPALVTKTDTGRDRAYILEDDARFWVDSLKSETRAAS